MPKFAIIGLVAAALAAHLPPPQFSERLIRSGYGYAFGLASADLDGDGDLDLTSADTVADLLLWFENDNGSFKQHFIQTNDPGWFERHAIGDVDGDGKLDVVVVKNSHGDVCWFRNSGTPGDGKLWQRHFIIRGGLPGAYDVALADFDGDGDIDAAASSWTRAKQFVWFENPGRSALDKEWTKHVIEEKLRETRTICVADFNADGKPDLLGTDTVGGLIMWYENTGTPAAGWRKHLIDDKSGRPIHGHPVDLDADGDSDVVMALGTSVAWYENKGAPGKGSQWAKHVLAELGGAFEAVAGDLDGDGKLDVAATAWGQPGRLVWLMNPDAAAKPWPMHVLKNTWPNANQVILADFDKDGRLDLAASAERGANELRWWRNEGIGKK